MVRFNECLTKPYFCYFEVLKDCSTFANIKWQGRLLFRALAIGLLFVWEKADSPNFCDIVFHYFINQNKIMEYQEKVMQQLAEIKELSLLAAKDMLTMNDAVLYTGLGKSYLYVLTCKNKIPYYKPNGKTIYFKKSELNDWLQRNRVVSKDEAESAAASYIARKEVAL